MCEIDRFRRSVLRYHFPGVPLWDSVCTLSGDDILDACGGRSPTLLTGGFPCQPASLSGTRKGSEDDRWLWPEMFRIIRESQPHWVIGENVVGLLSLPELPGMLRQLEGIGYEVGTFVVSAEAAGAPHRRQRVFIVASHAKKNGWEPSHERAPVNVSEPRISGTGVLRRSAAHGAHQISDTLQESGRQTHPATDTFRTGGETRQDVAGNDWRSCTLPDWSAPPPAFCRMDDGLSHRLDPARVAALGDAIVPRQLWPILRCIADIELSGGTP